MSDIVTVKIARAAVWLMAIPAAAEATVVTVAATTATVIPKSQQGWLSTS